MKKRLSFAWLLTIIYLGCMIPLILLMGGLIYTEYRYLLINNHTTTMRDLVHAVADPQGAEPAVEQTLALSRLTDVLVEQLRGSDFEVVVLDASGERLSPVLGDGPWLDTETRTMAVSTATPQTHTVDTATGQRVVYVLPIYASNNQIIGTIESSFSIQVVMADMRQVEYWLLLTVIGMLLLTLLMGPLLAQLAMRPLRGLVKTANEVGQGNLSERAPLSRVNEFQNLATTFNTMLDHIQATMDRQQQTADTMRRFVADVSHELRSPLNVLSGSVDVLEVAQQHGDQEGSRQATAILRSEVEGMGRLVSDLLLLARMESVPEQQGASLQITQIEPLPLLEEITERARLLATGQHIRMEWPETDPGSLLADASAVRR
ncbi:MAG: histidine kinase dimerization/phospho-acceptor domain-containing protein, partial [Chloroflexota bacterium]